MRFLKSPILLGIIRVGGVGLPCANPRSNPSPDPSLIKIGLASREVVLVPAASSKVVLLPEIVSKEAQQNGLLPETVKLGNQISPEGGLVSSCVC